jgi:hypothetical protein
MSVSLFYDPERLVAGNEFKGVKQGRFNPGVNKMKAAARAEREFFRQVARDLGQPLFTIMREDGSPSLYRQLMTMRRKVQRQGHVTIDKQLSRQEESA